MRVPADTPRRFSFANRRSRWAIGIAIVVVIVFLASVQRIASFYTNYLWFRSVSLSSVWSKTVMVQIGLSVVFTVIFFSLIWGNLLIADRLVPSFRPSEDELVSRWQAIAAGRMTWIRVVIAGALGLIGGLSAHSQLNNWLLFSNAVPFPTTAPWQGADPLNHLNDGFYVFRLPFLSWLVGWCFSALVVTVLLCLLAHYLNGGVRPHAASLRVAPRVKAHLSVLLALLALLEGVNYYLQRLSLVLSTKYIVDGATYTDIHATRPALVLLIAISVIAAGLLLYNVRQQGWLLPSVAVALWLLVWLLVANVYPAAVQALVVKPSENVKEAPYIQRNITATLAAYGLQNIQQATIQGDPEVTTSQVTGNSPQAVTNRQTLANVRLLDPVVMSGALTFTKLQGSRSYYVMSGPSTDRYDLPVGPGGKDVETQVLVSARDLNPVSVPSGWVNQHLQYTHGYGAVVAPANQVGVDLSDGDPNFTLANVPPQGQPSLSGPAAQPRIYFDDEAQSMSGYVIANSGQPELDYENASANETYSSYSGKGGVPVGGLLRRAAFALSMGDLNILISSSVTAQSRVIYYRNVVERLQKVAPFLSYDSDPYPVIIDGGIYWVVDAYTTTDNFPYSEQADTTSDLPTSSGLYGQSLNYVSNSVKAVVSAYSGQMWLFVQQPNDPIIETYEHAFPKLFTPMSEANSIIPGITSHWRYPEDLFTVQAEIYARYHQTKVPVFYNNAQQWGLAQNPVSGEVGTTTTTGGLSGLTQASGAISEQSVMPIYELMALPGQDQQSFVLVEPFVPQAAGASRQNLTALLTASSDPTDYGQLTVFTTPPNQTVDGPALVSTAVQENPTISKAISLLNTGGSVVVLGDVVTVPVGQTLLYVQPLYVEQATNALARLEYVIVVYNGTAYMSSNASLDNALCQVVNTDGSHPFGSYCSTAAAKASSVTSAPTGKGGSTTTTTTTVPSTSTTSAASSTTSSTVALPTQHGTVAQLLAAAEQDFADANAALRQGDLATYQADIAAAEALVEEAAAKSAGSPTGTTTVP